MRFRTKPFEINAVQFTGDNWKEVTDFVDPTKDSEGFLPGIEPEDSPFVAVVYDYLHNTWVGVKAGQWIIQGNKGEFYPCDPEIFEAKYEAID